MSIIDAPRTSIADTPEDLFHPAVYPYAPGGALYDQRPPVEEPQAPEAFPLNEIVAEIPVDPDTLSLPEHLRPRSIVRVEMRDPQVEALDPEDVALVALWESELCRHVRERRERGQYTRLPGVAGGTYMDAKGEYKNGRDKKHWGDQATREKIIEDIGPGAAAWLDTLPTGRALEILEDISNVTEVYDYKGRLQGVMDDVGRLVLTAATHSVAIRERYTDEALTFVGLATQYGGTLAGKRIASYGSGSAPGPMKGAQVIRKANPGAADPELVHYDINPHAVDAARELARDKMGFEGKITQRVKNLLNPVTMIMEGVKMRLTGKRSDISEAEGFWEYVDHDQLQAIFGRRGVKVPDKPEVSFLRRMYKATKDTVMVSQMVDNGPYPEFLDAIGWGHVVRRSVAKVMQAHVDAGIDPRQVDVRIMGSGVYVRYITHKGLAPGFAERMGIKIRKIFPGVGKVALANAN